MITIVSAIDFKIEPSRERRSRRPSPQAVFHAPARLWRFDKHGTFEFVQCLVAPPSRWEQLVVCDRNAGQADGEQNYDQQHARSASSTVVDHGCRYCQVLGNTCARADRFAAWRRRTVGRAVERAPATAQTVQQRQIQLVAQCRIARHRVATRAPAWWRNATRPTLKHTGLARREC